MALRSKVYIGTALRHQKTFLKSSFCSPPFKIANVSEDKSSGTLKLMLMSSSPGVLDGDEYYTDIDVAQNCSLELQTQSFQRLFRMEKGAAQYMNVHVQQDASFTYLPHPLVPHESSSFISKTKVHLLHGSSLVWGEVVTCGRKLNGEVFKFSSYHSNTEIYRDGKLVVKENLFLQPSKMNLDAIGQFEGYSHQATLILINEEADVKRISGIIIMRLGEEKQVTFGVSALQINGLIVKLLGHKAEQLFHLLKELAHLFTSAKNIIQKGEVYVI